MKKVLLFVFLSINSVVIGQKGCILFVTSGAITQDNTVDNPPYPVEEEKRSQYFKGCGCESVIPDTIIKNDMVYMSFLENGIITINQHDGVVLKTPSSAFLREVAHVYVDGDADERIVLLKVLREISGELQKMTSSDRNCHSSPEKIAHFIFFSKIQTAIQQERIRLIQEIYGL
jgi:hypothetical protein